MWPIYSEIVPVCSEEKGGRTRQHCENWDEPTTFMELIWMVKRGVILADSEMMESPWSSPNGCIKVSHVFMIEELCPASLCSV